MLLEAKDVVFLSLLLVAEAVSKVLVGLLEVLQPPSQLLDFKSPFFQLEADLVLKAQLLLVQPIC